MYMKLELEERTVHVTCKYEPFRIMFAINISYILFIPPGVIECVHMFCFLALGESQ